MIKINSNSIEETELIGTKLSENLNGNEIIAMYGDLGAGKTAFTRGIVKGLGIEEEVSSPTYSLVNEYRGDYANVFHFDMYRISSWEDLESIGFFDYIDNGILVIEWSENIEGALPQDTIKITINKSVSDNERIIEIEGINFENISA